MAQAWEDSDLSLPSGLDSPVAIQTFLDGIAYSAEEVYRCPRSVLRDGKGHCYDGAVLAAAALRRIGFPPLIVELLPWVGHDDDHILAIFKVDGRWGAVAKSNFVGLRYRDPVYASLRELVMSYFEVFFNLKREKTLRGYTLPLNLARFDRLRWTTRDETMEEIATGLERSRKVTILTPGMAERLPLLDARSFEAGLLGSDPEGLRKPD
ncbi:MAG TPA: transglutaminase domain-containing protein [Thermoanaerobaculia bacterium]|nr:transglutaminase domain-containing protein [Thermoanaerobaculia bacterium]